MPFQPNNLSNDFQNELLRFAYEHDFLELYRSYDWGEDRYPDGFPKIFALEDDIFSNARNNCITISQIRAIAEWGRLPDPDSIQVRFEGSAETINLRLFQDNGLPISQLADDPLPPLNDLVRQTRGLGPTYLSKVLRFCLPMEYGAIDTRIVRVFGNGDPNVKQHNWLSLSVDRTNRGFFISKDPASWPSDYAKWTNILRFLANLLNSSAKVGCPHPAPFVEKKLRVQGIWACADIEMAIFSYASGCIFAT